MTGIYRLSFVCIICSHLEAFQSKRGAEKFLFRARNRRTTETRRLFASNTKAATSSVGRVPAIDRFSLESTLRFELPAVCFLFSVASFLAFQLSSRVWQRCSLSDTSTPDRWREQAMLLFGRSTHSSSFGNRNGLRRNTTSIGLFFHFSQKNKTAH